ncbi:GIY-YIG nuclease family protein [Escherichia coli]|uniref:GIY-YIG nuclease family protein n=1 Tax=Escherichia coli TaxID=562 RepID=UPI00180E86FA|nr:GIY-YIG nuclease family protein [Escherichia coli]EET0747685.1 GIY-YIG nuclease family protein [Escherichia coli]EET5099490.1 GIY-YIG nuclease family protein [Escherichia coli]EFA9233390.1 GIY-YIG nuclease family protein [Escherichia coli]EFB1660867.1 GIY-YIG nuclease family protein [Escherichia coli]EIZ6880898.1 GIY-YIG nuclease family protein [Escherichia coli]
MGGIFDFLTSHFGVFLIGLAIGSIWVWKYSKKTKNDEIEKLNAEHSEKLLWLREKCDEKVRDAEYKTQQKIIELNALIENHRVRCKNILSKAVDYAFNFEDEFFQQHKTAQVEIQKVLDDTFRYKRKTLLSSVSLKNYEKKLQDIKKERELYKGLIAKYDFFHLEDHSDWEAVEKEFKEKVLALQAAQEEREYQNEIKRQMKEERQRQEELERRQREAEEEEKRLEEQQRAIDEALALAEGTYKAELEQQRLELEQKIADVHKQYERAKSMAQLTRQGHVYIISNIGSFGENVYKVGMTRRLEPMDRVKELGDASVPFDFDVHAMISCDDAPALEKVLHDYLERYRVNKVNLRKEFFRVELEKIIEVVKHHHGNIEYVANPAALQYYRTLEMEGQDSEMYEEQASLATA